MKYHDCQAGLSGSLLRISTTVSFVLLILVALASPGAQAILLCQNGATFDEVRYDCVCTPHYHGRLCEMSFLTSDPCGNWSSVRVLRDRSAMNRFGNTETMCEDSADPQCIDFSEILTDWYRLVSPAGNNLINRCPTGKSDCGSGSPYILVDEVPEDNANRILSKARAFRYRPGLSSGCYMPEDTSHPVRILRCSSALTLYYLEPLPSINTHYCIGDKAPCDAGLRSIDGTGFEPCIGAQCLPQLKMGAVSPVLRLDYNPQLNGFYRTSFFCNVFPAFETKYGVRYQIEFKLTYRNGTSVSIPKCSHTDVSIPEGQNKTFQCKSERVLTSQSNLYGGSLVCRVQARCNTSGALFNSVSLESNSHGFFFSYWFMGGVDVIRPDQAVSLCISSVNIPVLMEVTFYVSVGRQQIMLNDRTDVSVVRRDGNESLSCGFRMMNRIYKEKTICQQMTLYNHDPEGRVPLGLTTGDQISVIKVNISFRSSADGLFTSHSNGTFYLQKIQQIEMKVNLSILQTEVKTYLHIYTDPMVKPANSAYDMGQVFTLNPTGEIGYYTLIKHKSLPYEIQVKIQRNPKGRWHSDVSVVTEVSIRYVYNIIRIFGSSASGTMSNPEVSFKLPTGVESNPIPQKSDGLPFGVSIENQSSVMKVRFDLYGTILYIWGFSTFPHFCSSFVMSNSVLQGSCATNIHDRFNVGERFVLDLMLVPGFYDTRSLVEGLIYGDQRALENPSENLFFPQYVMKRIQTSNRRMQPTEVLSICTCQGEEIVRSNCFVSMENTRRERRQAENFQPPIRLSPTSTSNIHRPQLFTRKISEREADELCNKFVTLQLSKSMSTEICSSTKDPTGQADYISQFKLICAQYAATLGTFDFSQSLFNSMLGMCYTDMTYNATVVLGNATQIEALLEDLCPSNCSGRGTCLNGECTCDSGFWGASCEMEITQRDQLPVEISLLQRDVFCPSDNCSAAYLMVKPLLKTAESVCLIAGNSSSNYSVPSVYISGNIVMCELGRQHRRLVRHVRMYEQLQIKVTADTWESSNAVDLLVHQTRCQGGPVVCNENTMTCQIGSRRVMNSGADDDANRCLPNSSGAVRMTWTLPSMLMMVVIGLLIQ